MFLNATLWTNCQHHPCRILQKHIFYFLLQYLCFPANKPFLWNNKLLAFVFNWTLCSPWVCNIFGWESSSSFVGKPIAGYFKTKVWTDLSAFCQNSFSFRTYFYWNSIQLGSLWPSSRPFFCESVCWLQINGDNWPNICFDLIKRSFEKLIALLSHF